MPLWAGHALPRRRQFRAEEDGIDSGKSVYELYAQILQKIIADNECMQLRERGTKCDADTKGFVLVKLKGEREVGRVT